MRPDIENISGRIITHWYLRSTYLGEGTYSRGLDYTRAHAPFSTIFICWKCGDPWARVAVLDTTWHAENRLCDRCGHGILGIFNPAYSMPHKARLHDLAVPISPAQYQAHLITGGR